MWSRQRNSFVFVLSCLLVYAQRVAGMEEEASRQMEVRLELSRANAHLQDCVDNMYLSDINGDLMLREAEYLLFIAKESKGVILVEDYSDLPFPLVTNFVYGACFCSIIFQTPNCCVGAEAGIDLNPNNSQFIEDNLATICVSVSAAIADIVGPSTTVPSAPSTTPPTDPPIASPTSPAPTESPTDVGTNATTTFPSQSPSLSTTSMEPSAAPSMIVPATLMPTPESLTCVSFQYGIGNSNGFTANDIFNEIFNTLKTGLLIATRNVTIETLNSTFPRDDSRRRQLHGDQGPSYMPIQSSARVHSFLGKSQYELDRSHRLDSLSTPRIYEPNLDRFRQSDDDEHTHTEIRRRMAYLPKSSSVDTNDQGMERKLAFYTDEFMPVINSIVENPFCENTECAVVDSTVCVILEEGDDEEEVRLALLNGIEQSISDGSFYDAVPPEHQLPGGEAIDSI